MYYTRKQRKYVDGWYQYQRVMAQAEYDRSLRLKAEAEADADEERKIIPMYQESLEESVLDPYDDPELRDELDEILAEEQLEMIREITREEDLMRDAIEMEEIMKDYYEREARGEFCTDPEFLSCYEPSHHKGYYDADGYYVRIRPEIDAY